jgi:hypothetical protein
MGEVSFGNYCESEQGGVTLIPPQYFYLFERKTLDYLFDSQAFVGFSIPQYKNLFLMLGIKIQKKTLILRQ